jgi:hypothetical protein
MEQLGLALSPGLEPERTPDLTDALSADPVPLGHRAGRPGVWRPWAWSPASRHDGLDDLVADRARRARPRCIDQPSSFRTSPRRRTPEPGNSSTDQPDRTLGVGQPRQQAAPRPAAANGLGVQSRPVEHRQADDAVARGAAIAKGRDRRCDSNPSADTHATARPAAASSRRCRKRRRRSSGNCDSAHVVVTTGRASVGTRAKASGTTSTASPYSSSGRAVAANAISASSLATRSG